MRRLPKPIVAMVAGYAIGGGHVLHLVCDLTIAADNARFGQTGPQVGSFDGGYGAACSPASSAPRRPRRSGSSAASTTRSRRSRWASSTPSCRSSELEAETVSGAARCSRSRPFALRLMKASFHAEEDGIGGIQQLAHDANLLFYASDEAKEGREAYKAKRQPDFSQFPKRHRSSVPSPHLADGRAAADAARRGRAGARRHGATRRRSARSSR